MRVYIGIYVCLLVIYLQIFYWNKNFKNIMYDFFLGK